MTVEMGGSLAVNHHRGFTTPTPNQIAALERYVEDTTLPATLREGIHLFLHNGTMTYAIASETIEMVKVFTKAKEEEGLDRATVPGIYVDPKTGAFYLLKLSQIQRLYAMELVINDLGERNPDGTWKVRPRFEWIYQNGHGLAKKIRSDWRATPQQMKQWGDIWGHCIKCHSELTRQDSIERGMGKTCWENQFK